MRLGLPSLPMWPTGGPPRPATPPRRRSPPYPLEEGGSLGGQAEAARCWWLNLDAVQGPSLTRACISLVKRRWVARWRGLPKGATPLAVAALGEDAVGLALQAAIDAVAQFKPGAVVYATGGRGVVGRAFAQGPAAGHACFGRYSTHFHRPTR